MMIINNRYDCIAVIFITVRFDLNYHDNMKLHCGFYLYCQ